MITILSIVFWLFRVIVCVCVSLEIEFVFKALQDNKEIDLSLEEIKTMFINKGYTYNFQAKILSLKDFIFSASYNNGNNYFNKNAL